MCCSCGLGVGCITKARQHLCSPMPTWPIPSSKCMGSIGLWPLRRHSQIITPADDPVLARDEAARPHRNIRQLERLDSGLCLVAPYVNVAAVEGGEDPWLSPSGLSAFLLCPLRRPPCSSVYPDKLSVRTSVGWKSMPFTRSLRALRNSSVVSNLYHEEGHAPGATALCTYKSCLCAFKDILLEAIFEEIFPGS